jgi:hypothetical protein
MFAILVWDASLRRPYPLLPLELLALLPLVVLGLIWLYLLIRVYRRKMRPNSPR